MVWDNEARKKLKDWVLPADAQRVRDTARNWRDVKAGLDDIQATFGSYLRSEDAVPAALGESLTGQATESTLQQVLTRMQERAANLEIAAGELDKVATVLEQGDQTVRHDDAATQSEGDVLSNGIIASNNHRERMARERIVAIDTAYREAISKMKEIPGREDSTGGNGPGGGNPGGPSGPSGPVGPGGPSGVNPIDPGNNGGSHGPHFTNPIDPGNNGGDDDGSDDDRDDDRDNGGPKDIDIDIDTDLPPGPTVIDNPDLPGPPPGFEPVGVDPSAPSTTGGLGPGALALGGAAAGGAGALVAGLRGGRLSLNAISSTLGIGGPGTSPGVLGGKPGAAMGSRPVGAAGMPVRGTTGAAGAGAPGARGSGRTTGGRTTGGRATGGRSAAGGVGAAGVGGGRGRGRDEDKGRKDRDMWDDGKDWVDDDEAGPNVLQ